MPAQDNLGGQFRPIFKHDLPDLPTVHADSQPVSHQDFQASAQRGQAHLDAMAARGQSTAALSDPASRAKVADHAFSATREEWGGGTYSPKSGRAVNFHKPDKFALTVRDPDDNGLSIPNTANREQFGAAMDQAHAKYGDKLAKGSHYLGIFHDPTKQLPGGHTGAIDFDPVAVVGDSSRKGRMEQGLGKAKDIMSATYARGGAYHFASGDGFWPNHVAG